MVGAAELSNEKLLKWLNSRLVARTSLPVRYTPRVNASFSHHTTLSPAEPISCSRNPGRASKAEFSEFRSAVSQKLTTSPITFLIFRFHINKGRILSSDAWPTLKFICQIFLRNCCTFSVRWRSTWVTTQTGTDQSCDGGTICIKSGSSDAS